MNLSKKSTLSTTYPPHFILIKSVACSLALLASGQAIAVGTCTSAVDGDWEIFGTWTNGTGGGASCNGTSAIPAAGDNAIIDHDVTTGAEATINNLTVNAAKILTLSGNLTVNGTATINGGITYIGGTWPTNITSIAQVFVILSTNSLFSLPATVTSLGGGVSVDTTRLTLNAATVVTGNIAFIVGGGGSIAGVLTLAPTGNHTITALANGSTIPSLNLSGATADKTITSSTGDLIFNAVTFPSAASKRITFTAGTGFTISVPVPAATVATCINDGVAATASTTATVLATKSLVCTSVGSTPVNAPIDLKINNEVETYSEEISIK